MKTLNVALAALLCTSMVSGCSQSRTEKETTVTRTEDPVYEGERTTQTTTTHTSETETENTECGGVLSCTVDVIGSIIALPFKAVGALIGAIF